MLSKMKLKDKAVSIVVSNNGLGIITINDFSHLNEKSMEGLCQVLRRNGGTTGGVSNHGVAVPEMVEAKLQGIISYIKNFKSIGHTCTHAYVELSKVRAMYHQRDMEESHKDPEFVPTVNPRNWPKILETVEEYIRVFHGIDGQPSAIG